MNSIFKLTGIIPGRLVYLTMKRNLFFSLCQRWSRERIEQYQDHMLCKLVRHAGRNVPYYRELFKQNDFNPTGFRGRVDLHKIPLLDKEIIRQNADLLMAENAEQFGLNYDSTSGTSGTPLDLYMDDLTKANKIAAVYSAFKWAGFSIFRRSVHLRANYKEDTAEISKQLYNVHLFNAIDANPQTAIHFIELLQKEKPKVIVGFGFTLLSLGQYAVRNGIKLPQINAVITAGETVSENRRQQLESIYDCKVFDFYSLHECSAVIGECEYQRKHSFDTFAYTELIDDNDMVVSDRGEIVGTCLTNYAMPLIRYRMGDLVENDINGKCECGRNYFLVKEIIGRQNDFIKTPDGKVNNHLEHAMDNTPGLIMSQFVQDAPDHIYVNVVTDEKFSEESFSILEKKLRKSLGNQIIIDFREVEQLERNPNGKTSFIISEIGNIFEIEKSYL